MNKDLSVTFIMGICFSSKESHPHICLSKSNLKTLCFL